MVETLNELAQLRNTRFGRPRPRHGLRLLYWFANDCISFDKDNDMLSECDPAKGDFGFHYFENRYDQYGNRLLPDVDFPYYVVGNLNSPGAEELPDYVSEDKYTDDHNSNTDRIIVSLDEEWFDKVYMTQHPAQSNNYDPNTTYCISRGLLMIIRRMSLEDFLNKMGYDIAIVPPMPVINYNSQTINTATPDYTAVNLSSSDSAHNEPPAIQNNDTTIQIHDETPAQNNSLWERFCTIL